MQHEWGASHTYTTLRRRHSFTLAAAATARRLTVIDGGGAHRFGRRRRRRHLNIGGVAVRHVRLLGYFYFRWTIRNHNNNNRDADKIATKINNMVKGNQQFLYDESILHPESLSTRKKNFLSKYIKLIHVIPFAERLSLRPLGSLTASCNSSLMYVM